VARALAGTCRQRAERVRVDLVGLEPAQFLGNQVSGITAVQGHPAIGPVGPGQRGRPAIRPEQHDLPVWCVEADFGDSGARGLAAIYLNAQPPAEPGRDQVSGRVGGFGQYLTAAQVGVRLVQRGGEQAAPGRRAGPAQVGVAWLVGLRQGQQHLAGLVAGRRVSYPALGDRAEPVRAR